MANLFFFSWQPWTRLEATALPPIHMEGGEGRGEGGCCGIRLQVVDRTIDPSGKGRHHRDVALTLQALHQSRIDLGDLADEAESPRDRDAGA